VVKFYNGRGTAEQWLKEGKNAVKRTPLSCHDFPDNQMRPCRAGKGLANVRNCRKIIRKAHDGRGRNAICEIPVERR